MGTPQYRQGETFQKHHEAQMEEKMNMNWSWLSMIALNIFEFTKAQYVNDFNRQHTALYNIEILLSPLIEERKENDTIKQLYNKVLINIDWLDENLDKMYRYDSLGNIKFVDLDKKHKISIILKTTGRDIMKLLNMTGNLKFVAKDPASVLGNMGSS